MRGLRESLRLCWFSSLSQIQSIYHVSDSAQAKLSEGKCESLNYGRQGKEAAGRTEFGQQLIPSFANTHCCLPTTLPCPARHRSKTSSSAKV